MRSLLVIVIAFVLAACDSPEDRAETHYNRAVELVALGEQERAELEFRNALEAVPEHVGARTAYARLLREKGDQRAASAQYLRLAELDAEDPGPHRALAEIALDLDDMTAFQMYTQRAYELAPDDLSIRAMKAAADFREEPESAVEMAEAVVAEMPENVVAQMVLIGDRASAGDHAGALRRADAALELAPDSLDLHLARLSALEGLGEVDAIGRQLEEMAARFPDDPNVFQAFLQWQFANDRVDEAIDYLRGRVLETPNPTEAALYLVQVLLDVKGVAAAEAELESLVAKEPDDLAFQRARMQLDFVRGNREEAMAALRAMIEGQEPSSERREMQVELARMLLATDQADEARALVESVLGEDARHVDALKMRAGWRIAADRTGEALADLQVAGVEAPRDPEILTLMAAAHEREGATELVGERLARAVEASNIGIPESLRYARFLLRQQRLGDAEGIVLDALRRDPENLQLTVTLGQIHLERRDWPRVRQVANVLRGFGLVAASEVAAELELAALNRQGRADELVAKLESLAAEDGGVRARIDLARVHLSSGDLDAAQAEVGRILVDDPEHLEGRLVQADIHQARNEKSDAESLLRRIIESNPDAPGAHHRLYALLRSDGRDEEALAALEAGLDTTDRDGRLLLVKAGFLLEQGDFEGAISAFEELYTRDTSNLVVANNLASVLSTYRQDDESLERAFQVGRRLRGTEVPYFQDTYGWMLVRRGDYQQALNYLEPAAASLAEFPIVQYHLAMAYFGLERWDVARAAFTRAVELAGEESELPQIEAAREKIKEIDAMGSDEPTDG